MLLSIFMVMNNKEAVTDLILIRILLLLVSGILCWILFAFILWDGSPGRWSDAWRVGWVFVTLTLFALLRTKADDRYYRAGEKTVLSGGNDKDTLKADDI